VKSLEESLTQYAAFHRDRRNIATHFFGIPLIVFSVVLALSTVSFTLGEIALTAAALACIAASVHYFALDSGFGTAMAVTLFAMCAAASEIIPRAGLGGTLAIAAGAFAAGWALQLWGHRFEGMKPAFLDDARQLFVGPLFVCAEVFFLFGGRVALRRYIEERVGPTVSRRGDAAPTGAR
jgi:uncharacterized membrane protein YGL010W